MKIFLKFWQNQWQKTLSFVVILAQREFFVKTLAKYNCSGPPAFKCQIQSRAKYYSITISMQKSLNQSAQFIKSFVRYTWLMSSMIYKASPIFDHAHPKIIKLLAFLNSYQHAKNQPNSSIHSWDTADFGVLRPKRPYPFLITTIQKLLK